MTAPARPPEPSRTDDGPSARTIALIVAIGVGCIFVMQLLVMPADFRGNVGEGGAWHPPETKSEKLVAKMDGRAFAATAADPLMRKTVWDFHGDAGKAAYRASRPLPGWMFFAGSLGGQRALLAPTMLLLTALTIGWAVYSVDVLGRALGLRVRHLAAVVATPAVITAVAYPGIGDPFGLALSVTALAAWFRQRTWTAVALFAAAGLCRETSLLVPFGLALWVLWDRRSLRPGLPLIVAPLVYVGWVAVVTARIGAAPDGGSQLAAPFTGMIEGIGLWHLAEYLTAALIVASIAVVFGRGYIWMRWITVVNLAFSSLMGTVVWFQWWGFGRLLTIIPVFALVALSRSGDATVEAVEAADGPVVSVTAPS